MSQVVWIVGFTIVFAAIVVLIVKLQKMDSIFSQINQLKTEFDYLKNIVKEDNLSTKNDINSNFSILTNNNEKLLNALSNQLKDKMENFESTISKSLNDISVTQEKLILSNQEKLDRFTQELKAQKEAIEKNLENIRLIVDSNLERMRADNEVKLEQMRKTVDEKLHESLEKRLSESFKQVSERLEMVYKGLGEMQTLANGVGDLKKVLSNVKNRGMLGELQLEKILEDILSPSLYKRNVKTRPNSNEMVEFAVRLPGNGENDTVWLPIDAKFPIENYQRLIECYETGNIFEIANLQKALKQNIEQAAKDIKLKYLEVPYTTDFGIMFLPYEGLYSEVLRIPGLFELIMRDYKVVITGPTTIAAFLNSLNMGFRTLTIEKNAHKIMEILIQVQKEFEKFGETLAKAQKNIKNADKDLEELVGARTRKIQLALKDIETNTDTSFNVLDLN